VSRRPSALVIAAPGTNRDRDVSLALQLAGAEPRTVLVAELAAHPQLIEHCELIVVAGGFSYADALGAGRVFALELDRILGDRLPEAVDRGVAVLGICNGFQTLVRLGLLPGSERRAALGPNLSGRFDCRWVRLAAVSQRCVWTRDLDDEIDCPIAHGEGRFTCDDATWTALVAQDQVALTYHRNPNGSRGDVAGICDPTGQILGLMPHPENHILSRQHPERHRPDHRGGRLGLALFEQGVAYAKARA
jgi:phosphoribosylformylglycinamidine synthase subunit PurQ / glutaminase